MGEALELLEVHSWDPVPPAGPCAPPAPDPMWPLAAAAAALPRPACATGTGCGGCAAVSLAMGAEALLPPLDEEMPKTAAAAADARAPGSRWWAAAEAAEGEPGREPPLLSPP